MPAGYSGTPLIKKLGLVAGARARFIGAPEGYERLLGPLPDDVAVLAATRGRFDFIQVFVRRRSDLTRRMPTLRAHMEPAGMIWVSWPKKASGVATDVTEDVVREVAFANRLVDVKVCAVDETWSGLKLVIRKKDR